MSKIITNLEVSINAVQKNIQELEQIGMKIIDKQASELIQVSKERSIKRVGGKENHYNSRTRFSYKKSSGRVYFYLTKLIIDSRFATTDYPITEVLKKRKTYPYHTNSQIESNSKHWEYECLYYTRDILADITKSLSFLKEALRGLNYTKNTISLRGEKAQLDSAYCTISEAYIEYANKN